MSDSQASDVALGRLADPEAVDTRDLPGGCRCPGAPHTVDKFTFRTELGSGETKAVRVAGWASTEGEYYDWEAANDVLIAKAVRSWTLLTGKPCQHPDRPHKHGEPVTITRQTAALLDEPTRIAILEAINDAHEAYQARLPNESGDPSADTPPESGSPTPKTPRQSSNTTS